MPMERCYSYLFVKKKVVFSYKKNHLKALVKLAGLTHYNTIFKYIYLKIFSNHLTIFTVLLGNNDQLGTAIFVRYNQGSL
jgi:hypothetical protein